MDVEWNAEMDVEWNAELGEKRIQYAHVNTQFVEVAVAVAMAMAGALQTEVPQAIPPAPLRWSPQQHNGNASSIIISGSRWSRCQYGPGGASQGSWQSRQRLRLCCGWQLQFAIAALFVASLGKVHRRQQVLKFVWIFAFMLMPN